MNIYQIMEQTEIWVTSDKMPIKLVDMDELHRANTLAFLRRRPSYMMAQYYWVRRRMAILRGEAAEDAIADMARELTGDPDEWLERRPFIIELARLVANDQRAANTIDVEFKVCKYAHDYGANGCTDECFDDNEQLPNQGRRQNG